MDITLEQIKEAIELGYPVTVIINGEYYNFTGERGEKIEASGDFIDRL